MATFFVLIIMLVVVDAAHSRHHPKFAKRSEEHEPHRHLKRVTCSDEHDSLRGELMNESSCRGPRDDYIVLELASYEMATPSAVWVKRCKGTCDHHAPGAKCMPRETIIREIPIRIHNLKTSKQSCAIYPVEEHLSCECCVGECKGNRVLNPRKCSCQCPNMEERRNCLRKRNQNMRWNRSKCTCEPRPRRRVQ